MMYAWLLGLVLLGEVGADGAAKPIPQDTKQMEKHSREWLEWNRRTLQGAYDKVGKRDDRWDRPAHEALDLAARLFSKQVDPDVSFHEVFQAAKAAVDAGCDDPLVLYLYSRCTRGPDDPGHEEAARRARTAAEGMQASQYPPSRRAAALRQAAVVGSTGRDVGEDDRKEYERELNASLDLLPESIASEERTGFWEDAWFKILMDLTLCYRVLGMDAQAAYDRVDERLAKVPEIKVLRLQIRGNFWHRYAGDVRTNAFAPMVPAGAFAVFEKYESEAQKTLNEAWELRPGDAGTATTLLGIEKGIGGDRARMELWFERAMTADGDNRDACWSKLDWLDPKWHGTAEEMIAFGHACRDTKNWRAGIPLLAADAHYRYAVMLPPPEKSKYLGSPEVWSEIQAVYDEHLKHSPNDAVARSKYGALCFMAGHYPEAHAQFHAVGDRLTSWPEFPFVPLASLKQIRALAAQIVREKPGESPPAAPRSDDRPKTSR